MRELIIKSATRLSTQQKKKLEDGLGRKYKEKLSFRYEIEDILGGLVIVDGEKLIDSSIHTRISKLKGTSRAIVEKLDAESTADRSTAEASRLSIEKETKQIPNLIKKQLDDILDKGIDTSICGRVTAVGDGVVYISGLSTCKLGELLLINKDTYAIAMNLEDNSVGGILINNADDVEYGDIVYTTNEIVAVPVGKELLGRAINPLGQPVDGLRPFHTNKTRKIENPAPSIVERDKVDTPLNTGILAIDSMIPIGRGQRELIIGDRQTGKTSIAIDTIINQKDKNVICIYVAIAQRASVVASILRTLKKHDAMSYTTLVVSTADQAAPLQYIAPYTGCALAEEFMYQGKDVLIVYDDLSKHAVAYRTISLLLKRPSGREAYPGDIFYIHSRLLERAAKLSKEMGDGSITALPIIETQAGDISSYIPTNIISITDGQIYLEKELFRAGIRPAVNVGLSVSRVGGAAQPPAVRRLSSKLRLDLAHYRELAVFSQFGSELDETTRRILEQGEMITEALKQPEYRPMSVLREILYLYIIVNGHLQDIERKKITTFLYDFYKHFCNSYPIATREIRKTGDLTPQLNEVIDKAIEQFKVYFLSKDSE